jgi:hypothetical protein
MQVDGSFISRASSLHLYPSALVSIFIALGCIWRRSEWTRGNFVFVTLYELVTSAFGAESLCLTAVVLAVLMALAVTAQSEYSYRVVIEVPLSSDFVLDELSVTLRTGSVMGSASVAVKSLVLNLCSEADTAASFVTFEDLTAASTTICAHGDINLTSNSALDTSDWQLHSDARINLNFGVRRRDAKLLTSEANECFQFVFSGTVNLTTQSGTVTLPSEFCNATLEANQALGSCGTDDSLGRLVGTAALDIEVRPSSTNIFNLILNPVSKVQFVLNASDWTIVDAVKSKTLYLWLSTVPAGTQLIEWTFNQGSTVFPLDAAVPGLYTISSTSWTNGKAVTIQVRFSGGAWSSSKSATPTAASINRFAVWVDDFHAQPLTDTPVAISQGSFSSNDSAAVAKLNLPLKLSSGAEVEYIGAGSVFANNDNVVASTRIKSPSQTTLPLIRYRIYDPLGNFNHLTPCKPATETFYVQYNSSLTPQKVTIIVHGAASATPRPAISAVGLKIFGGASQLGSPVPFRFDRNTSVGTHPDGRPWALGPLAILRNNGPPVFINVNKTNPWQVVQKNGALLSVVYRPGLYPPAVATLTPSFSNDYARVGPAADWSAWASTTRDTTKLILRANFERISVYLNTSSTAEAAIRFRKSGTTNWMPAQALIYDGRPRVVDGTNMRDIVAGPHRGAILYLAPGTKYDVEAKQGSNYFTANVTTDSYEIVRTQQSITLPTQLNVTVNFTVGGTASNYAEYKNLLIKQSAVVNVPYVVFTNVQFLGARVNSIQLGPNAHHIRFINCKFGGWGQNDKSDPEGLGWGSEQHSAIIVSTNVLSVHHVLVMGSHFGSSRYTANTWVERNPLANGENMSWHPRGPQMICFKTGSKDGQNVFTDNTFAAHGMRSQNDLIGGYSNFNKVNGFPGRDSDIAYNLMAGAADDTAELEGMGLMYVILHNFFDMTPLRRWSNGPATTLGLSIPYWGPTYIVRNIIVRPVNVDEYTIGGYFLKIQRKNVTDSSRMIVLHNLAIGSTGAMASPVAEAGTVIAKMTGYNNLFRMHNKQTFSTAPEMENNWGASNLLSGGSISSSGVRGPLPMPNFASGTYMAPANDTVAVNKAVLLSNINDGGPYAYSGTGPDVGAQETY